MILRGNFNSEMLRMSTNIQVFIPEKAESFRIVYLLHGLHGDQGTWLDNTTLPLYAKKYNAIFVMPEAGRSFYTNQKYGRRYFDFISLELPDVCRKLFNISGKREDTAIMGCSMGGYGALRSSLFYPERFGFCGAIAPACLNQKEMLDGLRTDPGPWLKTGPEAIEILTDLYSIHGEALEYKTEFDILELAKNFSAEAPKPKIYMSCGTEDDLRGENLRFKNGMQSLGVSAKAGFDFTYEEWAGGHDWYFFNAALEKTLAKWYS